MDQQPIRVLIIGAGGHGECVADALLLQQQQQRGLKPIGFLDDNPARRGERCLGLPIYGGLSCLDRIEHDAVIIGIGDNRVRAELYDELRLVGEVFITVCHPMASVSRHAQLGAGTFVAPCAVVSTSAHIGDNVILNTSCTIGHHVEIGHHTHIAPGVDLGGEIQIGEGVLIGIGATVLPRQRIGAWSTVGAGAVVRRAVPEYATAVGIPARLIRSASMTVVPEAVSTSFSASG